MRADDTNGITRAELSGRIDTLGWGLLVIAIGAVGLVPNLPKDAWLIEAGAVMVGLSAVRARLRLPVRAVTTVVGAIALAAGIGSVLGLTAVTGSLVLIVFGVALLVWALSRLPSRSAGSLVEGR